jgi:hypothetical protein
MEEIFSAPEMALRRLPLLMRACFKSMATFADILRIGAKARQAKQYRHSTRVRTR